MATTIKSRKKIQMKPVPTLLQAIERVVELSKDSKMSEEFMMKAAPEIGLLADSYGITGRQAVLFCICMEKGSRRVDYDDLASHLNMNKISVLSYASDIDALVRRRLLKFRDVKDEDDFDNNRDFNDAKANLRSGEHKLMKKNIIEHLCEDGIAEVTRYKLTEGAKRTLLAELNINATEEKLADVISPDKLSEKQLFFPKDIGRQVDELTAFLQPENYQKIRERMKEKGFRNGFACLFYGGPGTGKTETVYQLARQTGRSIMVVDVPRIKRNLRKRPVPTSGTR